MLSRSMSMAALVVVCASYAAVGAAPTASELSELLLARGEQLSALCFNYGVVERPHGTPTPGKAPTGLKAITGFYGFDGQARAEHSTRCMSAPNLAEGVNFEYEVGFQNEQRRDVALITMEGTKPTIVNTSQKPMEPLFSGSYLVGWWLLNEVIPRQLRAGKWAVLRVEDGPVSAVVVGKATSEYWLAPHLGYSIVRCRSVGPASPRGSRVVYDTRFGNHRDVGGVQVPTTYVLSRGSVQQVAGQEPRLQGPWTEYAQCANIHYNATAMDALKISRQVPLIFGGVVRDFSGPQHDGQFLGYSLSFLLTEGIRETPFGLTEPTQEELFEYGKLALAAERK